MKKIAKIPYWTIQRATRYSISISGALQRIGRSRVWGHEKNETHQTMRLCMVSKPRSAWGKYVIMLRKQEMRAGMTLESVGRIKPE